MYKFNLGDFVIVKKLISLIEQNDADYTRLLDKKIVGQVTERDYMGELNVYYCDFEGCIYTFYQEELSKYDA